MFGAVLLCKHSATVSRLGRWVTIRMRCQHQAPQLQPPRLAVQPPCRFLKETDLTREVEEPRHIPFSVMVAEGQDSGQWTDSLTPMGRWFYEKNCSKMCGVWIALDRLFA